MGRTKSTKRRKPSKSSAKRPTTRSKRRTKRSKRYGGHSIMQRASKLRKAAYKKAKENQRNLMLAAAIAGTAGVGYGAHRYRKRSRVPPKPIYVAKVQDHYLTKKQWEKAKLLKLPLSEYDEFMRKESESEHELPPSMKEHYFFTQ